MSDTTQEHQVSGKEKTKEALNKSADMGKKVGRAAFNGVKGLVKVGVDGVKSIDKETLIKTHNVIDSGMQKMEHAPEKSLGYFKSRLVYFSIAMLYVLGIETFRTIDDPSYFGHAFATLLPVTLLFVFDFVRYFIKTKYPNDIK